MGNSTPAGLQCSAVTVVRWFSVKEVRRSRQRSLELVLQPVQCCLLVRHLSNSMRSTAQWSNISEGLIFCFRLNPFLLISHENHEFPFIVRFIWFIQLYEIKTIGNYRHKLLPRHVFTYCIYSLQSFNSVTQLVTSFNPSPTSFRGDLSSSCSHEFNVAHLEDSR